MILGFTLERPAARTPSRQAHRAARRATRDLLAIFSASASRDPELVKLTAASGALYNGEGEPMNCTEAWPSISFLSDSAGAGPSRLCWSFWVLLPFSPASGRGRWGSDGFDRPLEKAAAGTQPAVNSESDEAHSRNAEVGINEVRMKIPV